MIIAYIVLGLVLGLPLVLGLVFRVGAPHLFFSLMAGELLARYFAHDVGTVVASLSRSEIPTQYAEAAIIVLPLLLTAVLLKGTLSKSKVAVHFIPLLITGVVLAAFVLPVLPVAAQDIVRTVSAGQQLLDMSSAIVGVVVLFQLISLWLLNRSQHESGKKHR